MYKEFEIDERETADVTRKRREKNEWVVVGGIFGVQNNRISDSRMGGLQIVNKTNKIVRGWGRVVITKQETESVGS